MTLRHLWAAAVLAVACGLVAAPQVDGATVAGLYEAAVPVTGSGEAARNAAFAAALRVVAVRASGRRDAGDRLDPAAARDAGRLVQRFGDNPDGTLGVGFDADSVERVLAASGLPVWGSERPLTLVWLSVEDVSGVRNWLGLDAALPESRVLRQVADLRGVPLAWPVMDMEDRMAAEGLAGESAAPARITALAARYRADAVLVGRGRRDAAGETLVEWTLHFGETATTTRGPLAEGIHFAADRYAEFFAAPAGVVNSLTVDVTAVQGLAAYAETLAYLEGLAVVRSVAVEQVSGDVVRFRLAIRGDQDLLTRAIGLGRRLVPVQPDGGRVPGEPLVLRYQPLPVL